jgi:putative PIN family toxin of toxin-antitoxin system
MAVHRLLERANEGSLTLLWADTVADEAARTAAATSEFRRSIGQERLRNVLALLQSLSEPTTTVCGQYPLTCRDPGDDFIVAHALAGRADIVVTPDRDLLALGDFAGVLFVKPGAALALLRAEGVGKLELS